MSYIYCNRLIGKGAHRSTAFTGGFLERMKLRNKKVIVFFGSQTGTGEEFSTRLAKDASRIGMPAITFDPENVTDWVSMHQCIIHVSIIIIRMILVNSVMR